MKPQRDPMADEIARLRRWKAEAMAVLSDWEQVYEALGRPGRLGESKAKASKAEVLRLRIALEGASRCRKLNKETNK